MRCDVHGETIFATFNIIRLYDSPKYSVPSDRLALLNRLRSECKDLRVHREYRPGLIVRSRGHDQPRAVTNRRAALVARKQVPAEQWALSPGWSDKYIGD